MAIRINKKSFTISTKDADKFVSMYLALKGGEMISADVKQKELKERKAKNKAKAVLSINNPYVVFSDELANQTTVENKDGWLHFANPNYKSGREAGYSVADLRKAHEMFVADKYDEICVKTNVKMAMVGDYKVSETLVKIADAKNLL